MSKTKGYNGHKNWNHWNVSLWINNDERLYREARLCIDDYGPSKAEAARNFVRIMGEAGITHTPDGAPYSVSSVRAAMVGIEKS